VGINKSVSERTLLLLLLLPSPSFVAIMQPKPAGQKTASLLSKQTASPPWRVEDTDEWDRDSVAVGNPPGFISQTDDTSRLLFFIWKSLCILDKVPDLENDFFIFTRRDVVVHPRSRDQALTNRRMDSSSYQTALDRRTRPNGSRINVIFGDK